MLIRTKENILHQQQMSPQTPPSKQNFPREPPRTPQKRHNSAMSIVNPGSKRIRKASGIKYEDDDSDS
ncbi:hypothetical protein C0J52_18872 [Blattella germanica]|nr:hypothetical protein C0J52_18872 [Blattella germanica]